MQECKESSVRAKTCSANTLLPPSTTSLHSQHDDDDDGDGDGDSDGDGDGDGHSDSFPSCSIS